MSSGGAHDGMEVDDANVLRLVVDDVKNLDGAGKFAVKVVDGFPWKLTAHHCTTGALCVQIQCEKGRECPVWECEVEAELKLVNHEDESHSLSETINERFDFEHDWMEIPLLTWEELIEDTDFIADGAIVIEAKISVRHSDGHGLRTLPAIDFFSPSVYSDAVLIVEGQTFHVSKQILAHASSYFKALLYGNFKESQEKEIELNDISADKFVTALELIYDSVNNVNEENVEDLSRIAHLFDIPKIMTEVEKWLVKPNCLAPHKKLLLADQCKLTVAKARLLSHVDNFEDVHILENSESYKHYSVELMDEITKKTLELREKENERAVMNHSVM